MRFSIQVVLVIFGFVFCDIVFSQPCYCDDMQKTAICSRPMSLFETGCRMANKVLQNAAMFRRVFGGSPEPSRPQNTAFISPTLGQFTINADTSPLLLASSAWTLATNQATVTIVVLSVLLGVCVVIITVWGICLLVRSKKRENRKRLPEENMAAYEERRRQRLFKSGGALLNRKVKKEDAPTVKGDLEEWSDCESSSHTVSVDIHQQSNGKHKMPHGKSGQQESLL